jgi:hypothetical protein
MDLTTLTLIAIAFLGLVAGNAALYGDTLSVQISVPPKMAELGFTESAAEYAFVGEAGRITHVISAIPTPDLRITSQPTVFTALAKPLGLESVAGSLATQAGISRLSVRGAIITHAGDTRLDLMMLVTQPGEEPREIKLSQDDGDAVALVRHGADLALEEISPYRVALANYAKGVYGDAAALAQCKDTVTRDMAQPWVPAEASERAMERNLLALLALLDGDAATAQQELGRAASIGHLEPAARAIISLNSAFVAVALKQPAQAQKFFQQVEQTRLALIVADIDPRIDAVHALVLWSNGDLAGAEQLFRHAIVERPDDEGAHTYLSRLLAANGDAAGAAVEQAAAATSHYYDPHIMDLAQSVVWTDPADGGVHRRN